MTFEESKDDVAFNGLMKSLNLDESKFKIYKTNFNQLKYEQLANIKTEIESQLSTLFDVLVHYYNADMNTELLTSEGFPRSDIDVLGIRLVRVRIIRLRNDHKDILQCIEGKLIEQFQGNNVPLNDNDNPDLTNQSSNREESDSIPSIPFVKVLEVVPNSPASTSGLKDGDKVAQFGNIHIATPNKITSIAELVRGSINRSITVKVIRDSSVISLQVRPNNTWGGQGVLGCRITPL